MLSRLRGGVPLLLGEVAQHATPADAYRPLWLVQEVGEALARRKEEDNLYSSLWEEVEKCRRGSMTGHQSMIFDHYFVTVQRS